MMSRDKKKQSLKTSTGANLGFEEKLWQTADKIQSHVRFDVVMQDLTLSVL